MDQRVDSLSYLETVKTDVLEEIRSIIPSGKEHSDTLYDLMMDYPMRDGKALRPAISVAVCRALGGTKRAILPTAAVLELYHNAFLIHDDVEDESDIRRTRPTLHRLHGVPTAVNVGDGMLAMTIRPLLDNTERIGLGGALKILRIVSDMARISAEGQMTELNWIRKHDWDQSDRDYIRMVHRKTGWYSFIVPAMVGAIAAGASDRQVNRLGRIFLPLGIAFQIKDDLLNLTSNKNDYEKDWCGDLWEGKHTLILIHALRTATPERRRAAMEILAKPRSRSDDEIGNSVETIERALDKLRERSEVTGATCSAILNELRSALRNAPSNVRNLDDIRYLHDMINACGSLDYAQHVADRFARKFQTGLAGFLANYPDSFHSQFLCDIGAFAVRRTR